MSRYIMLIGAAVAGLHFATPASRAAIVCDGNFQMVAGTAVSTPFCQDENLAALRSTRAVRTSGDQIRRQPELKQQACTFAAPSGEPACSEYAGD